MFLLSHTWRIRLDKAAAFSTPVTAFLLRTLVTHPAILGTLLLLLMCRGNIGEGLMKGAETLLRDAPVGQVWTCETGVQDMSLPTRQVLTSVCQQQPMPRDVWADGTNDQLLVFYKTAVMLSLTVSGVMWLIRRANASTRR
jgi:hypothetical protein